MRNRQFDMIPNPTMIVRCEDHAGCKRSNLEMFKDRKTGAIFCNDCAIRLVAFRVYGQCDPLLEPNITH